MEKRTHITGLSGNMLKIIAIAAMVVDHCAAVLLSGVLPNVWILRMIGRITAPIMCFFIAEGYYHTSNLKKYMGRLLLAAVISHIPYNLCFGHDIFSLNTDVMFSLLLGLAALAICKSDRLAVWQKVLGAAACCVLSYHADWGYIAVLWILGFGLFYGSRLKQTAAFAAVSMLYILQPFMQGMVPVNISRLGVFLAIPLLMLYSGERGKKSKFIKWAFYWFYPIHLMIIYFISKFI